MSESLKVGTALPQSSVSQTGAPNPPMPTASGTVVNAVIPELAVPATKLRAAPGPQGPTLPEPGSTRPVRATPTANQADVRFASPSAVMAAGVELGAAALAGQVDQQVQRLLVSLRERSVGAGTLGEQFAELQHVSHALNAMGPSYHATARALLPLVGQEATKLLLVRGIMSKERFAKAGDGSTETSQTVPLMAASLFALATRYDTEGNSVALRALAKDVVMTYATAVAVLPSEEREHAAHVTLPRYLAVLAPEWVQRRDGQHDVGQKVVRPAELTLTQDAAGHATFGLTEPLISRTGTTELPVFGEALNAALGKLGSGWLEKGRLQAAETLIAHIATLP